MSMKLLVVTALLGLAFMLPATAAESLVRHDVVALRLLPSSTQPSIDEFSRPSPGREQAIVYIRVTVSPDGRVTAAKTIRGFFTPEQRISAETAVMLLKFGPKYMDGKPVESTGIVPLRFSFPLDAPRPPVVTTSLPDVEKMLAQHKWPEALARLDEIQANEAGTISDYVSIEALRVAAYDGMGDAVEALRHADELKFCSSKLPCKVPVAVAAQALMRIARLQRQLGLYADALRTYSNLETLVDTGVLKPFSREVEGLRAMATGDDSVVARVTLDQFGEANLNLFRASAARKEVTVGTLETAQFQCKYPDGNSAQLHSYDLPMGMAAWTIPVGAKGCSLQLTGQPGSVVQIVQSGTALPGL